MGARVAKKVLLLGWDAADWTLIRPLIEAGEMPALARLIESGASGNLATIQPILSPMLWTSIATGKRPHKHGIYGFTEPVPDGSGIRPVNSTSRTTKAIWNLLSQSGMASNVVGWLASHPAEPVKGTIVTDYFLHPESLCGESGRLATSVCHPDRLRPLLDNLRVDPRDIEADALLPFIPGAGGSIPRDDERIGQIASLLARTASVQAVACAVMDNEPWDFMAVYYDMIDQIGHHFMPYHPPHLPGVSADDAAIYGDVVRSTYRFHDMMLQSLLDSAGDDTTVILVSDHGFHSGSQRDGVNGFDNPTAWHRQQGVVCVSGPGVRPGETLHGASLLDVTPTVLTMMGLPLGRDMDGRPWLEILDGVDRPEQIDSWDDIPGESGCHPDDHEADPESTAAALEQLIALGYIEALSEDSVATVETTRVQLKTNVALALMDADEWQAAADIWQKLIDAQPDDLDGTVAYRTELAECHARSGRLDESERLLREALQHRPTDFGATYRLAQLRLRRGDSEDALRLLGSMSGAIAESVGYHVLLGQCYLQRQLFGESIEAFEKALRSEPDNAMALGGLARIASLRSDWPTASNLAIQAVGLDPQLATAHVTLGTALAELGCHSEAVHALETAVQIDPGQTDAVLRLKSLKENEFGGSASQPLPPCSDPAGKL